MAELTPFQIKYQTALEAGLAQIGARLIERQILGSHETYITARIYKTDLQVYIYSDEAQVQSASIDERFESPDFRTADLLCQAFVNKAVQLAQNVVM